MSEGLSYSCHVAGAPTCVLAPCFMCVYAWVLRHVCACAWRRQKEGARTCSLISGIRGNGLVSLPFLGLPSSLLPHTWAQTGSPRAPWVGAMLGRAGRQAGRQSRVPPLLSRPVLPSRLQFQRSCRNWNWHSSRPRRAASCRVSARPGSRRHSCFCRRDSFSRSHCSRWAPPWTGAAAVPRPGKGVRISRPVRLQGEEEGRCEPWRTMMGKDPGHFMELQVSPLGCALFYRVRKQSLYPPYPPLSPGVC